MKKPSRWSWASAPIRISGWFKYVRFWNHMSPSTLFLLSFVLLIAIGTAGLMLVPGLQAKEKLGFIDSLFTITSAVCVTGLTVADTATQFTFAGKVWILLFIQLGGIGLITLGTMLIGALGSRLSLRSEMLTMMPTHVPERPDVWQVARGVTRFTLVVELVGAALLFLTWLPSMAADEAAGHAVFHSISAYCNAGFSTFSDNLMGFQKSPATLLIISLLIIVGGLGFLTFEEVLRWWRTARAKRRGVRVVLRGTHRLSSHTWAALIMTGALLLGGWVLFAMFEWNHSLAELGTFDKIVNALFLSVTPRTAGFNTIDYSTIGNDSATLTIMLMMVGGSPGSTAGGLKTTTVAVLIALGLSRMAGKRFVELKDRAIPEGTTERAVGIMLLAMLVLTVAFFALSASQSAGVTPEDTRRHFLPTVFETVSAFATVGLSMNYTAELNPASKVVIIALMFIGRVGLLSFFTAMTIKRRSGSYVRPAQEDVIVG